MVGAWAAMLGVEFAVLWGLLAFFFNYVPTFGSILAAIPPVLLALLQFGPGRAAAVAAGYLVVNITLSNVIEPRLMGHRLGLSPLALLLLLVFWGWLPAPSPGSSGARATPRGLPDQGFAAPLSSRFRDQRRRGGVAIVVTTTMKTAAA